RALGAADGGYFPSASAWIALATLWVAAIVLLVDAPVIGAMDLALVAMLPCVAAFTLASAAWSSATAAAPEFERDFAYVGVVLAAIVLVRRATAVVLLGAVCVGVSTLAAYSLTTRLFPDRVGSFDPVAGYRLAAPIGYGH